MAEIIRIKCGTVNCYLVKERDAAILVDAGNAGQEEAVERALFANGVPPKSLGMVLLTHGHPDHVGTAAYFHSYYNVPVALHSADAMMRPMTGRGVLGAALNALSAPGVKNQKKPFVANIQLEKLKNLNDYGIDAEILPVPGHTEGSVAVLLPGGQMLAGDMYMNFISPSLAHIAEDFTRLRETHAQLREKTLTAIYPGHGKDFDAEKLASL